MKTMEFLPGTCIDDAAATLVANAPAQTNFNGICVRARYATTCPQDVVSQFNRDMDARSEAWANSVYGREQAAERTRHRANMQKIIDQHMERLRWIDFTNARLVLYWVGGIADAVDCLGVKYNHETVIEMFKTRGWFPNVNCDDQFNADDARNFAGWIVGQWLDCKYPGVIRFIEQWCERFDGVGDEANVTAQQTHVYP